MTREQDAAALAAALAAFVDVTSEFEDRNREDAFLRAPGGDTVKVKILRDVKGARRVSAPGLFHVSGSLVGPDGKTLKRDDGSLAIWPPPGEPGMTWSHAGHSLQRPEVGRDHVRRLCALRTINQEAARAMIDGELEGFDTIEGFEARKAAEAGLAPPEVEDPEPEVAAPPPPAQRRHPSGRTHLLHPGYIVGAEGAIYVDADALALAAGIKRGRWLVYRPDRPPEDFAGLIEVWPKADGDFSHLAG